MDGAVIHPQHICCQFYFRGLGPADGNKDVVAQVVGWLGQLRKASIVQYQVVVLALGVQDAGAVVVDVRTLDAEMMLVKEHFQLLCGGFPCQTYPE